MADRLNIGLDTDTETTGTSTGFFTGQRTVSPDVYKSSFVNFYTTSLGLPSLEEETGIEVDEPEDLELVRPGDKPERDERDVPNILEMTSLETGEPQGLSTVKFYDDAIMGTSSFNSYSDYLGSVGKHDRISFVENILEPVTAGKLGEVSFGKAAKSEVKTGVSKTKEAVKKTPSRIGLLFKDRAEMTQAELAELEKASASFARGAMGLAGPMGALAGSFIGGTTVKNAFGNNSFLPSGPLGMIGEVVHSIQYSDMAKIRAARSAYAQGDMAGTQLGPMNFDNVDIGFAMSIGNMGITRAPGDGTYSGNTQGLNIEQIKSLEAVAKGYDPRGYNMFDPTKSRSNVVADGGVFVSGNKLEGFFRGNGTFYNPTRFTSSKYSLESQAKKAAATAGISHPEFQLARDQALAGTKTLAQAIADIKSAKAAQPAAAAPSAPSAPSGEGEGPTITVGGKEYQVGTGAGQVDPGLAAAVQQQQKEEGDNQRDGAPSGDSYGGNGGGGSYGGYGGFAGSGRAMGGRIDYAPGGAVAQGGSGFVDRPPEQVSEAQSVADNRPTQLPEGAFVINAAAVEFAGSSDVKKMLLDAHKEAVRRGITVDKQGNGAKLIDVAISSGEVVVAPHLAKIIGYDRLEKINNRGKAETQERIEENGQSGLPTQMAAATGGFILGLRQSPQTQVPEGFVTRGQLPEQPIPSRDEDTFFNYSIGQIKDAIRKVEIKGFEDNPYIFTGISRKGKESSAFGPMQITYSTLEDIKERSEEFKRLDPEVQEYVDKLIQQGRDKVNLEKSGAIYRNDKPRKVASDVRKKLKGLGIGVIDPAEHDKYYEMVADVVLRQKLYDHDNLQDALASYGEGENYANKVLKNLQ